DPSQQTVSRSVQGPDGSISLKIEDRVSRATTSEVFSGGSSDPLDNARDSRTGFPIPRTGLTPDSLITIDGVEGLLGNFWSMGLLERSATGAFHWRGSQKADGEVIEPPATDTRPQQQQQETKTDDTDQPLAAILDADTKALVADARERIGDTTIDASIHAA